jgi:hypothetical protein
VRIDRKNICNLIEKGFPDLPENIRNDLKPEELKITKWTGFVRITEMELGDNFGCMSEFISWNPWSFFISTFISGPSD